jgi:exodeoxyribonuclease V beta subunit
MSASHAPAVRRAAFDLTGPLPAGTTVLEASAGTGKTFTIAALVARFVAEGVARLDEMLIVTFSRAATGELRERVRERLTAAERALADPGVAARSDDGVLRLLADGSASDVDVRRERLSAALRSFDAATIATTHGFCAQVLAGLGVTADLAGGDRFAPSLDDLVSEVMQDLYVRKFAAPQPEGAAAPLPRSEAAAIARTAAISEPHARLEPAGAPADSPAGIRRRLAEAVRAEATRRKRARGLRSYDDLQTDLAVVLADPRSGPPARARLRKRFPVVLIDEFQDTDPVQWEVVSRAFLGQVRLVLIGDPKQAIYGFRGADVTAYLRAVREADRVATLECNWRSEQSLLDAFDALFTECTFGDPDIRYRRVRAACPQPQLRDGDGAPLRLRWPPREGRLPLSGRGLQLTPELRALVAADVAADIVRLLESAAQVPDTEQDPGSDRWRPVAPGDLAVLVRTNEQAGLIREALIERGVPVVIGGAISVFTTPMAQEWLMLLEALEQPHRAGRVRAAALTCFLGWSAHDLATAGATRTDELSALVRSWAAILASRGVAALQETITATQDLPARILRTPDGERRMTDLRHIGEVLHRAVATEGLGITALVSWLRRRMAEADEPIDGLPERTRRLDSDADAVQVITVHRSKGLEFPIVYVPFAWDLKSWEITQPRYHDAGGERVLDIGCGLGGSDGAVFSEGVRRHQEEEAAEQLRLLYVALTRARSQAVLWWAPATTTETAPLSRLLFGRDPGEDEPALTVAVPSDGDIRTRFQQLSEAAAGRIRAEQIEPPSSLAWVRQRSEPNGLEAARFDRSLDVLWRRTSYSALTAAAHDLGVAGRDSAVGSEPEVGALDDEPAQPLPAGRALNAGATGVTDQLSGVVSPMAGLPGGTAFGSLVHGVLETVDPQAGDLVGEIALRVDEQLARWSPGGGASGWDRGALAGALLLAYDTPLGSAAGDLRLRDVPLRDRLTELAFELPLAGGDRPGSPLRLGAVGPLITRHLAQRRPRDPLAGYGERLADPVLRDQPLRGFLNGSLDAVLRLRDNAGTPRYVVADYKTNWLGAAPSGSGTLTAADYTPERMAESMMSSDYPLQALLYSVALHRFLRWRQPAYDPAVHLGGVLYLYLRGMCGADTPVVDGQPCGVFAWSPPAALVIDLSDLLDTGGVLP